MEAAPNHKFTEIERTNLISQIDREQIIALKEKLLPEDTSHNKLKAFEIYSGDDAYAGLLRNADGEVVGCLLGCEDQDNEEIFEVNLLLIDNDFQGVSNLRVLIEDFRKWYDQNSFSNLTYRPMNEKIEVLFRRYC